MKRHTLITIPLLILLALVVVIPVSAQDTSPVQATLMVEAQDYTIGDAIPLTLVVNHPADFQVIAPQMEEQAGWEAITIYSQSPPTTTRHDDGTATTQIVFDIRLFTPGAFSTPPISVTISDNAGNLSEVVAAPASIDITSVLVEGDTQLRDIKPQAEMPYTNWIPWLIGAGLLGLAGVALVLFLRRRKEIILLATVDNRLPHEVAIDELTRIAGLRLPERQRYKEHYTLVSDTLRVYVEKAFKIPVLERTTIEVQGHLKGTTLETDLAQEFIFLLEEGDLVKFAKFSPSIKDAQIFLTRTVHFIQATIPASDESESANDNKNYSKVEFNETGHSHPGTQSRSEVTA